MRPVLGVGTGLTTAGAVQHTTRDSAARIERHLVADITADLHADIGAGDVVEPSPIQGANLHVLDRLGLYGKIGSLCPRHRDETRRRCEESTFHHLHCCSSVFTSGGRVRSSTGAAPLEGPIISPRTTQAPNTNT